MLPLICELITAAAVGFKVLSKEDEVERQVQERLFMTAYIPTSLDDVVNIEGDLDRLARGDKDKLYVAMRCDARAVYVCVTPRGLSFPCTVLVRSPLFSSSDSVGTRPSLFFS